MIAFILLGLWAWRKSTWRNRNTVIEGHFARPSEEIQPCLQQKAGLEDEPKRRHEVEAQEGVYKIDGNELFELEGSLSRPEAM